ncbi:MAG: polyprenyl synthetase family protein [Dehalococcoidia bacterium]|nr:polyprenyl synthetase family protein [Dehalococcoidia bacterium]
MSLLSIFSRFENGIETELKSLIMGLSLPLYQMMAYHMGWLDDQGEAHEVGIGNRIHPTLCALTCEALGGELTKALPAAAALELVHNFSLIHNDIQDGTPERDHRPTVWWVWGPAQGINAGDGMHALARLSLLRQTERGMPSEQALRAAATLDDACLRLCEGQYLDLTYQERMDISQDAYFQMAEGKTAALMSCAAELGAQMASVDERAMQAMALYGRKLGLASQVRDDIRDLWGAENTELPLAGDILNKRKSLPIVYALQNATGAEKRALGDVYFKRMMAPEDIEKLIGVLDSLGAKEFSQETADNLSQEAIRALDGASSFSNSRGLGELAELAYFITTRES